MHLEVEGQLDEFSEELRTERAQKEALKIAKQQLQSQLKHMIKAEKDLTKGPSPPLPSPIGFPFARSTSSATIPADQCIESRNLFFE